MAELTLFAEWNRLSDISTSTRMYLAKSDVQKLNLSASAKMAKIHFAKRRHDRHISASSEFSYEGNSNAMQPGRYDAPLPPIPPPSNPLAVELPADDVPSMLFPPHGNPGLHHTDSMADMKYTVISEDSWPAPLNVPHSPAGYAHQQHRPPPDSPHTSEHSLASSSPLRQSTDHRSSFGGNRPSADYRRDDYNDYNKNADYRPSSNHRNSLPALAGTGAPLAAPPLPPKTPLQYPDGSDSMRRWDMASVRQTLPYPESNGPPPPVNLRRKPDFVG